MIGCLHDREYEIRIVATPVGNRPCSQLLSLCARILDLVLLVVNYTQDNGGNGELENKRFGFSIPTAVANSAGSRCMRRCWGGFLPSRSTRRKVENWLINGQNVKEKKLKKKQQIKICLQKSSVTLYHEQTYRTFASTLTKPTRSF